LHQGIANTRCSNPKCRRQTIGSDAAQSGIRNVGIAAHITAAAPDGPRYNSSLTPEQRRDESNGIWLCQHCAKIIDSDVPHFTVALLEGWKIEAQHQSYMPAASTGDAIAILGAIVIVMVARAQWVELMR
jgi:hypothetical protein